MKKLLSIIVAATLSLSVYALDIFTYAPINGNVKSYTQTDFSIVSRFGDLFRVAETKIIHNYDAKNLETEIIELNAKDVVLNKTYNIYDSNNNLVEQDCYDGDGILLWKTVITYKNNLKVDSSEYGKNGSLRGKVIYTYDGILLADETGYDSEGALVWKTIYKYEGNNVKTISQYDYNGYLDTEESYTYTDDGKVESITYYDSFTKTSTLKVFRYAANGLLNDIITYDINKQITNRLIVKYDSTGNVAKVSCYDVSNKFGGTVNELVSISEYVYSSNTTAVPEKAAGTKTEKKSSGSKKADASKKDNKAEDSVPVEPAYFEDDAK